jgi:DNA invertase Pin-like site-specific DNA recombinase
VVLFDGIDDEGRGDCGGEFRVKPARPEKTEDFVGVAYWYCRESHADSYANQNSKQTQEGICQSYYDFRLKPLGVRVGKIYYDPKTSARHVPFLQRTAGKELDRILQATDHVIFAHLDRGYRAVLDFSQVMQNWKSRGVTVHFASLGVDMSTPAGMLVANIMASVAQGESDLESERNL